MVLDGLGRTWARWTETYAKEQRLHMKGEPGNGTFKLKKRPNYLHGTSFKKFGGSPPKLRRSGGYDGYAAMATAVGGQGGYGPSYGGGQGGGYGGGRGRGGYGNKGPGGFRGGFRSTRSCHRSVHLLR